MGEHYDLEGIQAIMEQQARPVVAQNLNAR